MEPRSEDESDAGSLVDFICGSDEESGADSDDDRINDDAVDEQLVIESYTRSAAGARRSMRARQAPTRYVDDQWAALMTDDAEIDDVLSDSDVEESLSHTTEDSDYSDHHEASESNSDMEEEEEDDASYDSEDA